MTYPLKQTRNNNCAQTCVAMLTGLTIKDVEKVYGHAHATSQSETVTVLNKLGWHVETDCWGMYPEAKEITDNLCIVRIGWERKYRGKRVAGSKLSRFGHLMVYAHGWYFDPSDGLLHSKIPNGSRITHCAKIKRNK